MTALEAKELTVEASAAYHAETATLYATELSAIYEQISEACAARKFHIDIPALNTPERLRVIRYLISQKYTVSAQQIARGKFNTRIEWELAN